MIKRINQNLLICSAIIGLALGYIGGPVQILLGWGIIGLTIGYLSRNFRHGALNGAVFGFVASFVFMLHGYSGTDPLASKLLPFAALGAFGAVCGTILGILGALLKKLLRKNDDPVNG